MKKLLIAVIITAVFLFGLWPVAVPETALKGIIENSLKGDLTVDVAGLKKGLFYNFRADRIELSKSGTPLLAVTDFTAQINPFSLLLMKLSLDYSGSISDGSANGSAELLRNGNLFNVNVKGANIEGMPFFSAVGLDGTGSLSGELAIKNGSGDAKFSLKEAHLKSGAFSGITLPLEMFNEAKVAMAFSDKAVIRIVSFAMEGDSIYARLSGDIRGNAMDMKMELMPKTSFTEQNPAILMLGKYRVSPGYYSVPVKTTMPF